MKERIGRMGNCTHARYEHPLLTDRAQVQCRHVREPWRPSLGFPGDSTCPFPETCGLRALQVEGGRREAGRGMSRKGSESIGVWHLGYLDRM